MDSTDRSSTQAFEWFAEIVRRHQAGVCAAAYGVTSDRALSEDIAQETFLAAWRGRSTLRDPSRLREWLRGIARNLAHKARRRMRRLEPLGDDLAGDAPARDDDARGEARLVWAAMRELPEIYREALVLYYWEEQSARRVAMSLGITEATAMQRLSRGRSLLRGEVARLVEGTLCRARPGAALTAAILAAVAATGTGAGTASAAPSIAARTRLSTGVSRRTICHAGLTLGALRIVGVFGTSVAVLSGRRSTGTSEPRAPVPTGGERHPQRQLTAAPRRLGRVRPSATPSPEPLALVDDLVPDGNYMRPVVTGDGESSAGCGSGALVAALSLCFVDELVDRPCRIEIEVRDGKIATATVEAFEGESRRVVVRTLEEVPAALSPPELLAWFAAGKVVHADGNARLPDLELSMPVGEFVALCAKARLEGLTIAGPDGTRSLWFSWVREILTSVDWQLYLDLDVAVGPSRGSTTAPVTVATFVDITDEWGFGRKSISAWNQVLARYPDDVRVVVKLCPRKPEDHLAAEAIHAADAQGALWPMLERVAAAPERVTLEDLVEHARTLSLDVLRFRGDLEQRNFRDAVELDQAHQAAMDIDALPSAIVNGARVHGALHTDSYFRAIEHVLRRVRPLESPRSWRRSGSSCT